MFTRSLDGDLTRLVKRIDKVVADNQDANARAFVVFVAPQDELEKDVTALAEENEIEIPLSFLSDGPDGKGAESYKLNAEVDLTVLIAEGKKVTANFAVTELDTDAAQDIIAGFEEAIAE